MFYNCDLQTWEQGWFVNRSCSVCWVGSSTPRSTRLVVAGQRRVSWTWVVEKRLSLTPWCSPALASTCAGSALSRACWVGRTCELEAATNSADGSASTARRGRTWCLCTREEEEEEQRLWRHDSLSQSCCSLLLSVYNKLLPTSSALISLPCHYQLSGNWKLVQRPNAI